MATMRIPTIPRLSGAKHRATTAAAALALTGGLAGGAVFAFTQPAWAYLVPGPTGGGDAPICNVYRLDYPPVYSSNGEPILEPVTYLHSCYSPSRGYYSYVTYS